MRNKSGFTLAEALIVVVIIGVIAAITIPGVIDDYQRGANATLVRKTIAGFRNAVDMLISDEGKGHFSTTSLMVDNENGIDRFMRAYARATTSNASMGESYKYLDGSTYNYSCSEPYRLLGGVMSCAQKVNDSIKIDIDINGKTKPNIVGRDLFTFYINSEGKIANDETISDNDDYKEVCTSNNSSAPSACVGYLENNDWIMDY